jgi:UDP-N-acetyl-D-glucosamine dehydrogenase
MRNGDHKAVLLDKLQRNDASVCVVGLGYVGLPLAIAVAQTGHRVVGLDVRLDVVDGVNAGRPHIADVRPDELMALVRQRRLVATVNAEVLSEADVVIIAVPTPIDEYRIPDLGFVRTAAQDVARAVRPGTLVVLESTTYPGTTEEVLVPEFAARGFTPGQDLFVGYSPERIDPGNETWRVTNTPKVVSALTPESLELVTAFYSSFVEQVVPVSSVQTAEITKLFENIFRCINIALVNEFQQICDGFGIDVWEVIRACATKPYGFMPFYPGPGLGGHCVPVDPFYLAWKAREKNVSTEFIELAGRVNAGMARYIASKAAGLLNSHQKSLNGAKVALIGVAYKKNTADVRESPALRLLDLLVAEGASVSYHDPHVPALNSHFNLESQALNDEYLAAQDCAIIATDHDAIDWGLVIKYSENVLDTRNALGKLRPWLTAAEPATVPEATRDAV